MTLLLLRNNLIPLHQSSNFIQSLLNYSRYQNRKKWTPFILFFFLIFIFIFYFIFIFLFLEQLGLGSESDWSYYHISYSLMVWS